MIELRLTDREVRALMRMYNTEGDPIRSRILGIRVEDAVARCMAIREASRIDDEKICTGQ